MNLLFKLLSLVAAMAAGLAITFFVLNKKNDKVDCKILLADNRKNLIKKMNKEIDDIEKRTSPKNHDKKQEELNNVDWDNGACSY